MSRNTCAGALARRLTAAGVSALVLITSVGGTARADPIIQEVLYDGDGADADDVFTELSGASGTSLDGWTLVGINGDTGTSYRTVSLDGALIPPDGILVVATSQAVGAALSHRDFEAQVDWQNGPDAVQLRDPEGRIVDALQYGDAGVFNAGEGTPAPLVSPGQSLSRDAAGTDTGDNVTDFAATEAPSPGQIPSPPGELTLSVPDTSGGYARDQALPVRLTETTARGIVAAEVFISYDRDLLTFSSVSAANTLLTTDWTTVSHVTSDEGSSTDTLKIVMASGEAALEGAGALVEILFAVADRRRPAFSSLDLEHVLLNDGIPGCQKLHGRFQVLGADAELTGIPEHLVAGATVHISVADADGDRSPTATDRVEVRVSDGPETETAIAEETGESTGLFRASIPTALGAPVPGNGVVETAPGHTIEFCYDDSLDAAGSATERCSAAAVTAGRSGRVEVSRVSQPGDTLRVRVVDADLNVNPEQQENVQVAALNRTTGEAEALDLTEISVDDSVFFGLMATGATGGVSGDGMLTLHRADSVEVVYTDELPAAGGPAPVSAPSRVVGLFGDVDGNGAVQAFDASRVLAHALTPFLAGLDSLAANVDSQAPSGAITPFDAALILQQRVGLRRRFPVQESSAVNHPQAASSGGASRPARTERVLVLQQQHDHLSVWASDRSEIVSGQLVLEGVEGRVQLAAELSHFISASGQMGAGLKVVLAGATPVAGPGELLRVDGAGNPARAGLVRGRFNDGRILGRSPATGPAPAVPRGFALHPNRPNPFNPQTAIGFDLPRATSVCLEVFGVAGQQVRRLESGEWPAGTHQTTWDGLDEKGTPAGSGVYFCRLRAGPFTGVRRMLLLR